MKPNLIKEAGLFFVFIFLFVILSIFVPYFFTWVNFKGLLLSVASLGMIACTMMFCLASKDFDLSVGSQIAFAGVFSAIMINMTNSLIVSIIVVVVVGLAFGLFNGVLITKVGINAFITTLGTMEIIRGLTYIVSGGQAVGVFNANFFVFGIGQFLGVPIPVWVTILCFLSFGVLLNYSVWGKNALAVGGNAIATRLSGISVDNVRILNFTIQGAICALAGLILASRMTSGQPTAAIGFELNVISACVLGGVSLNGGKATISGVVIGVLIMGTLQNAMSLMNVDAFYQYVVRGTVLLLAVGIDQYRVSRKAKK